jgi:F0F1-type ATP synthase assembly protein I
MVESTDITTRQAFKEYELLAEDRRRAVEILLKALVIATALVGFGMKYLLETQSFAVRLILGMCGFLFLGLCHYAVFLSRGHGSYIHERLVHLSGMLGMAEPYCTRYVFNTVWVIFGILTLAWASAFVFAMLGF